MNVLLIDRDEDYRARFGSFLAENLSGLILTSAEDLEPVRNDPRKLENVRLILAEEDPEILEILKREDVLEKTVLLVSREESPDMKSDGIRRVFKYQRASSIISSVVELADAAVTVPVSEFRGKMRIIGVTGFPGGCGKTSFSMMYARLLRRSMGKSPVILPVGREGNLNDYFRQAKVKSDLNLLLLNFTSGFRVTPQRFIAEDEYGVSAFVLPEQTSCDIADLSREEIPGLLEMIAEWGFFDTLILDISPQVEPAGRAFLRAADRVVVLHDYRRGIHRSEQIWLEELVSACGTELIHVMNMVSSDRVTGEIFVEEKSDRMELSDVACHIPYDAGSFFFKEGAADLSMSGSFARSVASVAERM